LYLSSSKENMTRWKKRALIAEDSRKDCWPQSGSYRRRRKEAFSTDHEFCRPCGIVLHRTPETVCRKVAQQLSNLGEWDRIQDKIIYAKDVRQVWSTWIRKLGRGFFVIKPTL
jgi:hypothetical protein